MRLTLLLFCILLGLISCRTAYYNPNIVNTPALAEKGDCDVSVAAPVAVGEIRSEKAVNVLATASPVKYGAIMTNLSYDSNRQNESVHRCRFLDLGIGGYYPICFNRASANEMLLSLSSFGGFSIGDIRNGGISNNFTNVKFNRYFLQFSAVFVEGTKRNVSFRCGAGFRFSQMLFYQGKLFGSGISGESVYRFQSIDRLRNFTTQELTLNVGAKFGPYHCFLGVNKSLGRKYVDLDFNRQSLFVGLGFDIRKLCTYLSK